MRNRHLISTLAVALLFAGTLSAQENVSSQVLSEGFSSGSQLLPASVFSTSPALPRMAPDLALERFAQRADHQLNELPSYSAVTRISAELPQSNQSAVFELERHYSAPKTLQFVPVQFSGDSFVKHNVINRVLQQEVDNIGKQVGAQTAISERNYKFSYRGESEIAGRAVHVYQVKPRANLAGLFKGHVYLDVRSGALLRAEGKLVKSPSFFIKKIEFATDYADVDGFSLPIRIHSDADVRIVGRVVMDIATTGYSFTGAPVSAVPAVTAASNPIATTPASTLADGTSIPAFNGSIEY